MCSKSLNHSSNSIINIIGGNKKDDMYHFDNGLNIHMSSMIHKINGYVHNLDALIISHQLRVSYPKVDVPKSNISIIWTPISKWYVLGV